MIESLITTLIALSGMRPTGNLHLGNYLGAIVQFLALKKDYTCFFFVADLHAMTEVKGPTDTHKMSIEVLKTYVACGVDPSDTCTLYFQSDVPEICQISTLLGSCMNFGRARNCTTFKERIIKLGIPEGEVAMALFFYPLLMGADILSVRANTVPVGEDQLQHIEMTREMARCFNHRFNDVLTVPKPFLTNAIRVPGIDGSSKMGKSDGNTISLTEDARSIKKKVMGIPTQTNPGPEMTDGTAALFRLVELCSPKEKSDEYKQRYHSNDGKFFGEMKKQLAEDIIQLVTPIRERFQELSDDEIIDIARDGARRVRSVAGEVLEDMQTAMGIRC